MAWCGNASSQGDGARSADGIQRCGEELDCGKVTSSKLVVPFSGKVLCQWFTNSSEVQSE